MLLKKSFFREIISSVQMVQVKNGETAKDFLL
jgi:hypothetical protein